MCFAAAVMPEHAPTSRAADRRTPRRHVARASLAAIALVALPGRARAACTAAGADLSWVRAQGAEECPTAASLRAEVGRRLGRPVGVASGGGKVIEAVVERTAGGWSVRIATSGCGSAPATRVIDSDASTCAPIASAATLVIALALDPESALAPPAPPAPPGASPPAAGAPPADAPQPAGATSPGRGPALDAPAPRPGPPPAPPPRGPEKRADSIVEARTTLRGLVAFGLLPQVAPGLAWSSEWRVPSWLVVAGGVFHLPEQPAADPTYAFGMTAGWAGVCADLLRFSGLVLGPCARILAGAIHVVMRTHPTIIGTDPGQRAWGGASLGARLGVRPWGPLQAELGGDLIAPITRHEFVLANDPQPIFRQGPAAFALYAGAGVAFP